MKSFRSNPPHELHGIPVVSISDFDAGINTGVSTGTTIQLEGLPKSNVLQYFLEDGSKVTMRPSGTEPKIKFYFSVNREGKGKNMQEMQNILDKKIDNLQSSLMEKVGV